MTKLFLDDLRVPHDTWLYTHDPIYLQNDWVIVRNYKEFCKYIKTNPLPALISFDHDLADSHYTPEHYWDDYEASKKWQEAQVHTEETGYECAKFLSSYCMDKKLKLPAYLVHSMNPVGRDNILNILSNHLVFNK